MADVQVRSDLIVEYWPVQETDLIIGDYQFSRQTPPLSDMDIMALTPGKSKRKELISLYADIDGLRLMSPIISIKMLRMWSAPFTFFVLRWRGW